MDSKFSGKTVPLQPINSDVIKVPREVIAMMQTICTMLKDLGLEDTEPDNAIPVQVKGEDFAKVLEYCKHYIENPPASTDEKKKLEPSDWDKKFCDDMSQQTLFSVILAANFLDVKPLLDCTCLHIALKLKSMTPEEIRKEYNITKEFTPEEEEKARKEFEEMILQTTSKQGTA
eukprot:TRINITY_DN15259_c0_g1_i1.p1 TRINITY_DN15259_c0_g1~~TRINITY_DN15259_c0_g1_i1.p1  ORF type:complete len:192 (-),score=62.29 TRINITY_DN15259_c0_g1_i1:40-561(-)